MPKIEIRFSRNRSGINHNFGRRIGLYTHIYKINKLLSHIVIPASTANQR